MNNHLIIETINLMILSGAVIALVYSTREIMNWKITISILVIVGFTVPNAGLFSDNKSLSLFAMFHSLIYIMTIIISVIIVDRDKKWQAKK